MIFYVSNGMLNSAHSHAHSSVFTMTILTDMYTANNDAVKLNLKTITNKQIKLL